MIFTKRGPIEIHFKLSHYVSLALTIAVGISSIIYYSIVGISSAIDVAQKDIITEASANLPSNISKNKSNIIQSDSVLNEINLDEIELNNNKIELETNISLPEQTNEINFNDKLVKNSEKFIKDNILENKLDLSKKVDENDTKIALNSKSFSKNPDTDLLKKDDHLLRSNEKSSFHSTN